MLMSIIKLIVTLHISKWISIIIERIAEYEWRKHLDM